MIKRMTWIYVCDMLDKSAMRQYDVMRSIHDSHITGMIAIRHTIWLTNSMTYMTT